MFTIVIKFIKTIFKIVITGTWIIIIESVIKSPKQSLGDLLFLLRFLLFFSFFSFLSVDHELVHGGSQELLDRISWNLVEL